MLFYSRNSTITSYISVIVLFAFCSCQSTYTKNGTPENIIVFKDSAGHSLTRNDIENATGQVNYEIIINQAIDTTAKTLHNEAKKLGQDGKYDLSIAKLEDAIKVAPQWAYPTYDLAYTYLLKHDFQKALEFYKKTDQLEPLGFFTTKTAIYSLEGEQSGIFPPGLYLAYLQIEWADNLNKKLEITKAITEKIPGYAPAWKELALLLTDMQEKQYAIEKGLCQNPDADTKGILEINKAIILNAKGDKNGAQELLGNLIFASGSSRANIELAKFTLRSILE